jgi:hypothetical protein
MRPDFYTKAILTVIACALVALVAQNAGIGTVRAQSDQVQKVQLCSQSDPSLAPVCADVGSVTNSKGVKIGFGLATLAVPYAP